MHNSNNRRNRRGIEKVFVKTMTENFSQINIRHQITETGISENTKEDECKKLLHLTNIIFKLQKIKDKEKDSEKKNRRGENTWPIEGKHKNIPNFSSETMQSRRKWSETFQGLRGKKTLPRTWYPVKISFESEGKIDSQRNKNGGILLPADLPQEAFKNYLGRRKMICWKFRSVETREEHWRSE